MNPIVRRLVNLTQKSLFNKNSKRGQKILCIELGYKTEKSSDQKGSKIVKVSKTKTQRKTAKLFTGKQFKNTFKE